MPKKTSRRTAKKKTTEKTTEIKSFAVPVMCAYHDNKAYTIEVQLPGVDKGNIHFEMSETGFCLKAPRDDIVYFGCWALAHSVDPAKTKASYKEGLLKIKAPLAKRYKGIKLKIE